MALTVLTACAFLWPSGAAADPLAEFAEKEQRLYEKAAEVDSLEDKLAVLDETIEAKLAALAGIRAQIVEVRRELDAATDELIELLDQYGQRKESLGSVVRVDYLGGSPGAWEILAGQGGVSASFSERAVNGSLGDYAMALADELAATSERIEQDRKTLLSRTHRLEELESASARQVRELAAVRDVRADVLRQTRGEEGRFQTEYEQAREKLEQLGLFGRAGCERVGRRIWSTADGYFNQCDSRWADATLGFSGSTIGDYGCGVASAAMVFKRYGIDTDPIRLNAALKRVGAFDRDLLYWNNVHGASGGQLKLAGTGRGAADWEFIDTQLADGDPVIVWVDRPGQYNHYVVLLGKDRGRYLMHDPIEGPNKRFDDYYSTGAVVQYVALEPK
ncbi:MAG: C39 family peptidase [bacterium]|nr:C39 family peptidase [bacterium]